MPDVNTSRPPTDAMWLRLLLDCAGEAFYTVDCAGSTTLCNAAFLRMLGFAAEADVLGRKLHDVIHHSHPDGSPYAREDCPIYRCAQDGTPAHVCDEDFFRLDGTALPVEYWVRPIVQDGALKGAICTFIDVTDRRSAQVDLTRAIAAKDVLLEEVNHRVKNSLQLVMSLLSLQARQPIDGDARQAIREALGRIGVVARVHQQIYSGREQGTVDVGDYLAELVGDSVGAFSADGRIALALDVRERVPIGIDRAVSLALVVSEVVTNALKYGFGPEQPGTITLGVRSDSGTVHVTIANNGNPFTETPADTPARGLGTKIITALSRQIRADTAYSDNHPGTRFELRMRARPGEELGG